MTDPRVQLVTDGYDAIAERFLEWAERIDGDPRLDWLADLMRHLPDDGRVLELGCGAGEPCTRILTERFQVTAVDASAEQLRLAARHAPAADLVQADILEYDAAPGAFDAVCSFYVLNHVPREHLRPLFVRIASWLRPGGLAMHAFGVSDNAGWSGQWLGAETFFASYEPETNRRLVGAAGLTILRDEVVSFVEPDHGDVSFQWILAER